ncbi:MAG: pilus assembly protein [Deltaproteobacteria bacterium]|nr:pilus assembly protein [Deltaproteobacteria bacterium]
MEFAIVLPFLTLAIIAMVDTACMLNAYLVMLNATHAGVRAASALPQLEPGASFKGLTAGQGCAQVGTGVFQSELQQRVVELLQQGTARLDPATLCIETRAYTGGLMNGQPEQDTVVVHAEADYLALFPMFRQKFGIKIAVESVGPSLS